MASVTFITFLFITVMLSTVSAKGGLGSCCRYTRHRKVQRDLLKCYYKLGPPSCSRYNVVFITLMGKRICSDPDSPWTEAIMTYLNHKKWQYQSMNFNNCTVNSQLLNY
ncbi:eotaxin-like isoform X2 [Thalassophryne amazonica]|uniref:eotaxin-like isoform X2 n=1 Tax=Thalassophryne amazonica TaxID=390379 RepID=UPI001471EB91|nr:eotaxin-like isoform X2 [Thalassophryne amazonica]